MDRVVWSSERFVVQYRYDWGDWSDYGRYDSEEKALKNARQLDRGTSRDLIFRVVERGSDDE